MSSYTSENMLIKHKEKCGEDNKTPIKTSNESYIYWKKHFHKNPSYFRIYANFEADNEIDNSSLGDKQLIFINNTHYIMDMKYYLN